MAADDTRDIFAILSTLHPDLDPIQTLEAVIHYIAMHTEFFIKEEFEWQKTVFDMCSKHILMANEAKRKKTLIIDKNKQKIVPVLESVSTVANDKINTRLRSTTRPMPNAVRRKRSASTSASGTAPRKPPHLPNAVKPKTLASTSASASRILPHLPNDKMNARSRSRTCSKPNVTRLKKSVSTLALTSATTSASTSDSTSASTSAPTSASTSAPTSASTSDSTSASTSASTSQSGATSRLPPNLREPLPFWLPAARSRVPVPEKKKNPSEVKP